MGSNGVKCHPTHILIHIGHSGWLCLTFWVCRWREGEVHGWVQEAGWVADQCESTKQERKDTWHHSALPFVWPSKTWSQVVASRWRLHRRHLLLLLHPSTSTIDCLHAGIWGDGQVVFVNSGVFLTKVIQPEHGMTLKDLLIARLQILRPSL